MKRACTLLGREAIDAGRERARHRSPSTLPLLRLALVGGAPVLHAIRGAARLRARTEGSIAGDIRDLLAARQAGPVRAPLLPGDGGCFTRADREVVLVRP